MNSVRRFDLGAVIRARDHAMETYERLYAGGASEDVKQACGDAVLMADMLLELAGYSAVKRLDGDIIYSIIKSNKTAQAAE